MCEIHPKHADKYILEVWSSHPLTPEDFKVLTADLLVRAENMMNRDGRIRVHVHHYDPDLLSPTR